MSRAGRPVLRPLLPVLLAAATIAAVAAQDRRADPPAGPTAADYARAEKFLAPNLASLVVGGSVAPNWLPDERLWYRNISADGTEFILVDPVTRTREPAFDHVKLAATLSAAAGSTYQPRQLPFQSIDYSADGSNVLFDLDNRRWSCGVDGKKCEPTGQAAARAQRSASRVRRRRTGRRRPRSRRRGPELVGRQAAGDVARRQARRVHPRLEPLGSRHDHRRGAGADHRRREVLRLRHRQRRLEQQRPRHRPLVARLEEAGDVPAGRARGRRDVPRHDARQPGRSPDAARLEVPAARRQGGRDAAPRRHRRGHRPRDATADASGLPPRHARRQRQRCATCSGARTRRAWRSSRPRATTSRRCSAWPTWPTAPCAPWWTRP